MKSLSATSRSFLPSWTSGGTRAHAGGRAAAHETIRADEVARPRLGEGVIFGVGRRGHGRAEDTPARIRIDAHGTGLPSARCRRPASRSSTSSCTPMMLRSARQLSDLAEGLAARGFDVDARPSNRAWDDCAGAFPIRERAHGVDYRRVWRPPLRQASVPWKAARTRPGYFRLVHGRPRAPPARRASSAPTGFLAVLVARAAKCLRPSIRIAHWCFAYSRRRLPRACSRRKASPRARSPSSAPA